MNNENIRVSLAFARGTDHVVEGTGYTVHSKLYAVPEYANPSVTEAELGAGNLAYTASLAELVNGGKLATARKNACRDSVTEMLKKLAYFVQIKWCNDMALLLSSGFEPVSVNRTRVPLPKPTVLRVESGMTGQTIIAARSSSNVRSWQAEYALIGEDGVPGEWMTADPATDSRRILISNLIPGRLFAYRVRGVGGSTGFSDWSDTVTSRAA